MFQVELIWNREFNFLLYGPPHRDLDSAIKYANAVADGGDGGRVKATRIVDGDGDIVWAYGKKVPKNVKEPDEHTSEV